jgi:hypothetical protein
VSIANENNRIEITATATQTTFAYNFKIDAESEIAVYLTPTGNTPSDSADLLTLTTDYTLTGVGNDAGGNIVLTVGSYPTGAAAGDVVVAVRNINYDQQDEYVVGQDNAENFEASLDRMAMRIQRLEESITRTIISGVVDPKIDIKMIDIGDWDMVADASVQVAHGLSLSDIISISAIIKNDGNTNRYDFMSNENTQIGSHHLFATATDIALVRAASSVFNNTNFDSTSYNRGVITIIYAS